MPSSKSDNRRSTAELAALPGQLYEAVLAKPGETIAVLALAMNSSAQELKTLRFCCRAVWATVISRSAKIYDGPRLVAQHPRIFCFGKKRMTHPAHRPPQGVGARHAKLPTPEEGGLLRAEAPLPDFGKEVKARASSRWPTVLRRLAQMHRDRPTDNAKLRSLTLPLICARSTPREQRWVTSRER